MTIDFGMVIAGLGTAAIALLFFYFPWQTFVVDQTRQRIFQIRDEWFDYSCELSNPMDREVAAKLRDELNVMIRMAHHVTLPVIATALVLRLLLRRSDTEVAGIDALLREFETPEVAERAKVVLMSALNFMAWALVRRSLLAIAFLPVIASGLLVVTATFGTARVLIEQLEQLIGAVATKENKQLVPRY